MKSGSFTLPHPKSKALKSERTTAAPLQAVFMDKLVKTSARASVTNLTRKRQTAESAAGERAGAHFEREKRAHWRTLLPRFETLLKRR